MGKSAYIALVDSFYYSINAAGNPNPTDITSRDKINSGVAWPDRFGYKRPELGYRSLRVH